MKPMVESSDRVLWIETTSGVARLDPAHVVNNQLPPPVSIRSVAADGRQYSAYADASMPSLTKEVRFDYDGMSLTIPERVKFRYRLKGLHQGWSTPAVGGRPSLPTSHLVVMPLRCWSATTMACGLRLRLYALRYSARILPDAMVQSGIVDSRRHAVVAVLSLSPEADKCGDSQSLQ